MAVLAFKAVYTLESCRRENDRRVTTLYVEMKDMMLVLVEYVSRTLCLLHLLGYR